MIDGERYFDVPSTEQRDVTFVCCEVAGQRFVIGRYLFGRPNSVSQILYEGAARQLAKQASAKANAADALQVVRAASQYNFDVFESGDDTDEQATLLKVEENLFNALSGENAFESAVYFARGMKISGFDDLFYAFRDRWRPAVAITEEMALQAAVMAQETFLDGMKYHRAEVDAIQAGTQGEPAIKTTMSPR